MNPKQFLRRKTDLFRFFSRAVFLAVEKPAGEDGQDIPKAMPAPTTSHGRSWAKRTTGGTAIGQPDDFLLARVGVFFHLLGPDTALAQFRLDDVQGLGFHAFAVNRDPIEQVQGVRILDIGTTAFHIKVH